MSRIFIEFTCPQTGDSGRVELQLFDMRLPRAVANLLYLVSAHEIPDQEIRARESFIKSPLPVPLKGTKILRCDPGQQFEIGAGSSTSVFPGGCYDDEQRLVPPAAANFQNQKQNQKNQQQQQELLQQKVRGQKVHEAGTLSICNCGENSNGSRYFFSLCRRPELDGLHQIIGTVAPHSMELFQGLAESIRVNSKKGNVPEPAIVVSDCGILRAVDSWKNIALGTTNSSSSSRTEEAKMFTGRGAALQKRGYFTEDQEKEIRGSAVEFAGSNEEFGEEGVGVGGGGRSGQVPVSVELGEIERRRAKRRRIEEKASGAGAWVEPVEMQNQESYSRGGDGGAGAVGSSIRDGIINTNNSSTGNGEREEGGGGGAWGRVDQAPYGQIKNGDNNNNGGKKKKLTERNIFAMAARTAQHEQDLNLILMQQKAKGKHNNNNKGKGGKKGGFTGFGKGKRY